MKKITLLLFFVVAYAGSALGQCTNSNLYPSDPIPANNMGTVQQLSSCIYTQEYSKVSGIIVGGDYIFSCVAEDGGAHKYITVKNSSGTPIAQGTSPLSVDNITSADIELHFTEGADCITSENCHITTLFAVLTCPVPVNVQLSAVTTTSATFAWAAGGAETAWEVILAASGDPAPTATTSGMPITGTSSFTATTLAPGQEYCFYVRANCGSEFSPWRNPYCFSSACLPSTVLNENLESSEYGDIPECWTGLMAGQSEDARIRVVDYSVYQGDYAMELDNADSPTTAKIMLISPPLSTLATATHRVKFFARSYGDTELHVGSTNAMTANGTFTLKQAVAITDEYAEYAVDFSNYVGTDTFLAFRHANSEEYAPVFIDNIRWEVAPLCPDVTALVVEGETPATAQISWAAGGAETQWDVVFGPESATDPALLTPISPAPVTATATLSGLTPNTTYNAWIRSSCGTTLGNGAWIGPITFTTACLPTNAISENFDTTAGGDIPDCWSAILEGEELSDYAYIEVSTGAGIDGTKAIRLYNSDSGPDSNIILVSPNLSNLSAGTHRLKFSGIAEGTAMVDVGTVSAGGVFTSLETVELTDEYDQYVVNFTGYAGSDTYIGIKHVADFYTGIMLDNVRWEVAPLCADVTEVEVHTITTNSASVFWIANASETLWDVVYGGETVTDPNTLTPISPAPSVSPGAALTGLTPNTTYNLWVRSACGGIIGNGAWIGPIEFTTACLPTGLFTEDFESAEVGEMADCWTGLVYGPTVSDYAYVETVDFSSVSGDNSTVVYTSESGPDDYVMLVSPNLNNLGAGTHRLKFMASAYDPSSLQIGTLNGNTETGTFTLLENMTISDEYEEYVIDFTGYAGTDTYIAFRNMTEYASIFIDDVKWEVAPLCPDVLGITLNQVTTTSANVNWTSGTGTGWQVVYGPESATDPTTLTPSSVLTTAIYPIMSLTDDTSYNVWVRTVCGGTAGNGTWMGPVVLSTLCIPGALPYMQDFESADAPELPGCTTMQNVGDGNDWVTEDDPGYGFTNNTLVYNYHGDYPADVWYYTRGLPLTGGTAYKISYRYGDNDDDSYSEKLEVKYGTSPDSGSMNTQLADHPEINSGAAAVNQVTFTPSTTGTYYFGFHAYSNTNQYYLYVDDIVIDTALGTADSQQGTFTYYPNPVKDILRMSYTNSITSVTVYNLLGQAVIEDVVNQNDAAVNMSRLAAGSYIVKVTADGFTKTIKVIKQ